MESIDRIYYINLDHRTDRRQEIEGVLDDLEFPVEKRERISAVYDTNYGTVGCAKSHILALERFIASNLNTCLILEDDFIYDNKEQFTQSIRYLFSQTIAFDLVQLAYNHNGLQYEDTNYPILKKVNKSGTISAILIHKQFAPTLLNNYEESQALLEDYIQHHNCLNSTYIIDVYWQKLQPDAKWFCFMPRLGHQRASYSDIEKKEVDYGV